MDQIKSLPSPPAVVCTVMEVILTLLQQHGWGGGASGVGVATSEENVLSGSEFSQRCEGEGEREGGREGGRDKMNDEEEIV